MNTHFFKKLICLGMIFSLTFIGLSGCGQKKTELVNVSYDATREFYKEYNRLFEDYWYGRAGEKVEVIQSHGGSGKQALEVANGLGADVVTLALEGDVNVIRDEGLIDDGYINDYSDDSSPYTSTIVFLVRKGNPKNIKDWDDLLNDGVKVITPNPKTSGVVSLKRLLNQSNLKSWSSKMIKKSLEAYFFTLKNKIVFCKKQFQNMSVFCFVSTEIV